MPLPSPPCERTPQHQRQVTYRSYARADGLWDIEGELIDTKTADLYQSDGQLRLRAGSPLHHMQIRVTIDPQLQVHALEASMEAHPLHNCPGALAAMQRMVGTSMRKGWRKSIDTHLAGIAGCTHMRELLLNMATAAFQSITSAFTSSTDQPPVYAGRCTGWDFNGPAIAEHFPQFVGWILPAGESVAQPPAAHNDPAPPPT